MTPPNTFFWQIESLWAKKFSPCEPLFDWEFLKKKYAPSAKKILEYTSTPNFELSGKKIFEDENNIPYQGLKKFSLCFERKKPIYIVDNHQNALLPFFDLYKKTGKKITIVHIDAHRDDAIFPHDNSLPSQEKICTENTLHTILQQCKVSDYLDAGKKIGMVGKIFSITQSSEFENFSLPTTPYILNLDIDIYGPEGTAVDTIIKTEVIAKAWNNAEIICFATSPGFIKDSIAERLGKIFIQ